MYVWTNCRDHVVSSFIVQPRRACVYIYIYIYMYVWHGVCVCIVAYIVTYIVAYRGIYRGIYCGIYRGIYRDIYRGISWHISWHIVTYIVAYIVTYIVAYIVLSVSLSLTTLSLSLVQARCRHFSRTSGWRSRSLSGISLSCRYLSHYSVSLSLSLPLCLSLTLLSFSLVQAAGASGVVRRLLGSLLCTWDVIKHFNLFSYLFFLFNFLFTFLFIFYLFSYYLRLFVLSRQVIVRGKPHSFCHQVDLVLTWWGLPDKIPW